MTVKVFRIKNGRTSTLSVGYRRVLGTKLAELKAGAKASKLQNAKHVLSKHLNFESPIYSRIQDDGASNFVIVEQINRSQ